MKIFPLPAVLLIAHPCILLAQTVSPAKYQAAGSPEAPLIVDVHASPYRASINYTVNISKRRFDMHNATIVNMIDFVYGREDDDGRENEAVSGGPTWIDLDRFDVVAVIPADRPALPGAGPDNNVRSGANAYDKMRLVMRRVLTERFRLKYHTADRVLPGYVATVAKEGSKLVEAKDAAAPSDCRRAQEKTDTEQTVITCTSETMEHFLQSFGGVFPHPIINRTGFTKPYNFTLKLSSQEMQTRAGYIHALTDAFRKQLGIVIALDGAPQPAIVIDTVEQPTANPVQIETQIGSLPDLEFEVASVRPVSDQEPQSQSQIRHVGSQIDFINMTMQELLTQAWSLPTGAMLGNVPPWLGRARYTIRAKLPQELDARAAFQDQDTLASMLQKLLVDRFQIKYHWGEQEQDGWELASDNPKMKKANPGSRSFCKYGPPEGEKDIRTVDSAFNAQFHCQNVTMGQFADLLQPMARSEIKNRVSDVTGLTGSYDFSLYYTTGRKMRVDAAAAQAAAKQNASLPDPVTGLSVEDAFRRELGLRLKKRRGTYPALILDHIEQVPTEN